MTCPTCGAPFEPRRKEHRFCSGPCRAMAYKKDQTRQQAERDAKIRLLLNSMLETGEAIKVLLQERPT